MIELADSQLPRRLEGLLRNLRGGGLPPPWALAEYDIEQGITLRLEAPGRALTVELEAADPARPCFARTARFNVYYSRAGRPRDEALHPEETAALLAIVTLLRSHEPSLLPAPAPAESKAPVEAEAEAQPQPPSRKVVVRELRVERLLVREDSVSVTKPRSSGSARGPAAYYLNPYVGCLYGCPFCYASHRANFSRSLEGAPLLSWGRWLDVKVNAAEVLRREVAVNEPGTVRMSPIITDPYQPVERRYRITRACLELLGSAGFTPIVLTRSPLVLDDLELLRSLRPAPFVGLSIPTDDDSVRAAIEPDAPPIEERFQALEKLRDAGLTTFAILQPMLPLDPLRLVERLAPLVRAVRIGPLYEKSRIAERLVVLGRREVLEEPYERATFEVLREGFSARGVVVNGTEAPWSLLT